MRTPPPTRSPGRSCRWRLSLGSEVRDPDGRSVGRLRDVVVHWTTRGAYPRREGDRGELRQARVRDRRPVGSRLRRRRRCGCARPGCMPARSTVTPPMSPWSTTCWTVSSSTRVESRSFARPISIWPRFEMESSWWGSKLALRALLRRIGPRRLRSASASGPGDRLGVDHRVRPRASTTGDVVADAAPTSPVMPGAGLALDRGADEVKRLKPSDIQAALESRRSEPSTATEIRHERGRQPSRRTAQPTRQAPALAQGRARAARDPRPRADRRQRRQRRRWDHHLRQRRGAVRLPDAVPDGPDHGRRWSSCRRCARGSARTPARASAR